MMADESRLLDQQIHDAYDRVSLDEEAYARMLGQLKDAQARRQEKDLAGAATSREEAARSVSQPSERMSGPRHRKAKEGGALRGSRGWKILLPLAAAVMLIGVVVRLHVSLPNDEAVMVTATTKSEETLAANGLDMDDELDEAAADAGAVSEEEAYQLDEATSEAFDGSAEDALRSVDLYPCITLEDGTVLTALVDAERVVEVSADEVGKQVGSAQATPFDDAETVACTVFELPSSPDAYAVNYVGETTYWRCEPLE